MKYQSHPKLFLFHQYSPEFSTERLMKCKKDQAGSEEVSPSSPGFTTVRFCDFAQKHIIALDHAVSSVK